MSDEREFTGKTVEEAVEAAAETFGTDTEHIKYTVVQEAKNGFFKKKDAIIKAYAEKEEEPEKVVVEEKTEEVLIESPQGDPVAVVEETEETVTEPTESADENTENLKENTEQGKTNEDLQAEFADRVEYVKEYLVNIIRHMGVEDISIEVDKKPDGALLILNCASENKGNIIGKRGETLDALQYLASVVVNRDKDEYYRINLDSNGYREKRKKTLQQLALKIAKNVARSGRSNTLEPMNPYERRIIHSVISDFDGVSSHSVGEEPYRKVVITSDNPRPRYKKNYRNGNNNNRRRRYRDDSNYVPKRKSLDSMKSSFEKEYSKPKPEDNIDSGLYGKIDL